MDPLREAALRDAEGEALVTSGGEFLTWAALDREVDRAALRLAGAGVEGGSLVATLLPPGPAFLALLHAVPRLGGVLVPLNPGLPPGERERALQLLDTLRLPGAPPPLVVGDPVMGFSVLPAEEITGDAAPPVEGAAPWRPSDVELADEAPVVILLTSGSTGSPRPIPLTRGNLLASARMVWERLRLDPADRWLASLSPAHVGGLALLHRGAVVGSATVFPPAGPFDPEGFLALADAGEVTHASLVPIMLRRLLDARGAAPAPRALRCVLLGGAATPAPLLEEALARRWPVALTWGMTEASSQVATAPPDQVRRKPGSVGRPLRELRVEVVDASGRSLPRGAEGELRVAGPTVAPLPGVARAGGWHASGDLGRFDSDGDLWITGRASDRIISGGVTVDPGEVEAVLMAHPGILEVAVAGVPDPVWGERVEAWVAPAPGEALPPETELQAWARERLAPAKRPRGWHPVAALPRNANGKVDRKALQVSVAPVVPSAPDTRLPRPARGEASG